MNTKPKRPIAMTITLIIITLIAVLLVLAATKPDTFRIERSITINATPETIFPLINNFHEWVKWSPWEKKDVNMKRTYSDPAAGQGARYAWAGNNKIGEGNMEITQSIAPAKVLIALNFLKPFEASNTAEFTLTPQGDATQLTWEMYGPNNFIAKIMQVFISMDTMVSKDFEAGLNDIKTAAESNAANPEKLLSN